MTAGAGHGTTPRDGEHAIRAAGGLLERRAGDRVRIAVVRRRRYRDRDGGAGDLVLPKGKVRAGESLERAALREVEEETGCRPRIVGPARSCEYLAHGKPKVATYFPMACEATGGAPDAGEVAEAMWLVPAEAGARLSHDTERRIVAEVYGSPAADT